MKCVKNYCLIEVKIEFVSDTTGSCHLEEQFNKIHVLI